MPNLIGLPLEDAKIKLLEMGFFSVNILERRENDNSVPEGCECRTTIPARQEVSTTETITLYYVPVSEPTEEEYGDEPTDSTDQTVTE